MSVRLKVVVATTRPMSAYGGVRFTKGSIEQVVESLKNGIPFGLDHDPRKEIQATLVDAFMETAEDGEIMASAVYDIDEATWAEHGHIMGGVSITCSQPYLGEDTDRPVVVINADAHWFSNEQIEAAYSEFTNVDIPVRVGHLYQFSTEPPVLVVATFLLQGLASVPFSLLASYIYESFKFLLGRREKATTFSMTFDGETGNVTSAHLETSSDEVMRHAIDSLPAIIGRRGKYEYSAEKKIWEIKG